MAYLDTPRLTFSGKFQADPSTVNNDPNHFNNETFTPNDQLFGDGAKNGWWNPEGTGNFRFVGCTIKSVTYNDGTSADTPEEDWIIGKTLIDSNERVAGKIVDLDSQQQTVSELWGLTVRLTESDSDVEIVRGDYKVAPFADIWWVRSKTRSADGGAAAIYQSVVTNLQWNDELVAKSRYLRELKAKSANEISIKFNTDIYTSSMKSPDFTLGRITGSIGPSNLTEPKHFTLGRQFIPQLTFNDQIPGYLPDNQIYFATAKVNLLSNDAYQIALDLGDSFQTTGDVGAIAETRNLYLAVTIGNTTQLISEINYKYETWYETTAGIVNIDITDEQYETIKVNPLCIVEKNGSIVTPLLPEVNEYVRADYFVQRLNPEENSEVEFYATKLGQRLPNTTVICQFQNNMINLFGQGRYSPTQVLPPVGTPTKALQFENELVTDANGKAVLSLSAFAPFNPRGYIDGQLYAIWYYIKGKETVDFTTPPATLQYIDPNNFVSVLVWDTFKTKDIVWEDIQPVLQQYSNLYPLMSKKLFDMANKEQFDAHAKILRFVFSMNPENPNYMPATRDLSRDKREAILNYLDQILGTKATATSQSDVLSH